ncbi:unnamed protein product [Chrysodeixis includens]|uniref:Uncharacterized protein n=1 Tax=Chrysodeixis includens TaxID=689277 RepID=A0A9P0BXS5_CHRIL|nr:unnamed protein product [Chrysodeixis includens]
MADPTPEISHQMDQLIYARGTSTYKVIRRVAIKLQKAIENDQNFTDLLESEYKQYILTGIQPSLIEKFETTQVSDIQVRTVDRCLIYNKLVYFYLIAKTMPTSYQLFFALKKETPVYMDIADFRKLLANYGFMWKHISEKIFVVVEKPEVIFDRYFYLTKIVRYRAELKPIYFVAENAFDDEGNYFSVAQVQSKSKTKALHKMIYVVSEGGIQCLEYIEDFSSESFFKWVKDNLSFMLPESSVIVLSNKKRHCEEIVELPTPESCRKDIMAWLDYFNVPYDTEFTKPLLYDLVQKCTDATQKLYKVDEFLKTKGHTVLRIPKSIERLTLSTHVADIIRKHLAAGLYKKYEDKEVKVEDVKAKLNVVVSSVADLTPQLSELIIREELSVLDKDVRVEDCIEELENSLRALALIDSAEPSVVGDMESTSRAFIEEGWTRRDNEYDSEIPSCDSDAD